MGGWLAAILGALAALAALALLWLIVWLARRRRAAQRRSAWGSPTRASRGAQDIERLFRDAAQKTKIRDLPVYLLIGDQGSGKTSLILNSGLQSELLAGQNRQGSPITPTERLNLWLINGSLVIEAPAPVWKDHSLATVLLRQLRYPALKTMLGRRRNAPRAVIACIPADLLGSNTGLGASVGPVNEFLLLACKGADAGGRNQRFPGDLLQSEAGRSHRSAGSVARLRPAGRPRHLRRNRAEHAECRL
jgi:type VI protein secretion system component VasK